MPECNKKHCKESRGLKGLILKKKKKKGGGGGVRYFIPLLKIMNVRDSDTCSTEGLEMMKKCCVCMLFYYI